MSESRYYHHTFRINCRVTTTNVMSGFDLLCYKIRFVRLSRQFSSRPFLRVRQNTFFHGQKLARFHLCVYMGPAEMEELENISLHLKFGTGKGRSQLCTLSLSKIRPAQSVSCERKVEPCKFLFVRARVNGVLGSSS